MDLNTFALRNYVFSIDDFCMNRIALRVRLGNPEGRFLNGFEFHLDDGIIISRHKRDQELAERCFSCDALWECKLKVKLDNKDCDDNVIDWAYGSSPRIPICDCIINKHINY